jgi:hypothetical protein
MASPDFVPPPPPPAPLPKHRGYRGEGPLPQALVAEMPTVERPVRCRGADETPLPLTYNSIDIWNIKTKSEVVRWPKWSRRRVLSNREQLVAALVHGRSRTWLRWICGGRTSCCTPVERHPVIPASPAPVLESCRRLAVCMSQPAARIHAHPRAAAPSTDSPTRGPHRSGARPTGHGRHTVQPGGGATPAGTPLRAPAVTFRVDCA